MEDELFYVLLCENANFMDFAVLKIYILFIFSSLKQYWRALLSLLYANKVSKLIMLLDSTTKVEEHTENNIRKHFLQLSSVSTFCRPPLLDALQKTSAFLLFFGSLSRKAKVSAFQWDNSMRASPSLTCFNFVSEGALNWTSHIFMKLLFETTFIVKLYLVP